MKASLQQISTMSFNIPFDIQEEIIKQFPVKSILRFRSVSKEWKSLLDNPEFIRNYHINRTNPRHHLLVQSVVNYVCTYTSIIDDNTFPIQKFPIPAPEPLNLLGRAKTLGSADGLICFDGWYKRNNKMVVLWNPSIRKSVCIPIPNAFEILTGYSYIAFGVCHDTYDPKLVKINVFTTPSINWEVQVFALSSRVWKTVYTCAPFKSCHSFMDHVCIDGFIYWHSRHRRRNFLLSFDLKSEKFGEVCLTEILAIPSVLKVVKVNKLLGLLEYYEEGVMFVCGVWMRKDGVNKPFTKMYTVKCEGKSLRRVLGFRNNGDVLMDVLDDDFRVSKIEVYEPSSGRVNSVGITEEGLKSTAWSYMETLLLLDESNSIIH